MGDTGMTVPTEGDLLGLIGVYGYIGAVILLTRVVGRRVRNPRKLIHILTGGIVFFWWSFDTREIMAGLAALPFVIILLLATEHSPVRTLREGVFGSRTGEGHEYGLVLYAISWTLIAYFMADRMFAASLAIAAMSFGDGMGEFIGRSYGRRRYHMNRTIEGSLAVLATMTVSVVIIRLFYFDLLGIQGTAPEMLLPFALALGGFVTCLEAITPGQIDNLVIPLTIAGYLAILGC
jgi:dolichol kinase